MPFTLVRTLISVVCMVESTSLAQAFEYGEPTDYEQAELEWFNRARANPSASASQMHIDINEGISNEQISPQSKQPLSFNAQLQSIAQAHSQAMIKDQFFAHETPKGQTFNDRIRASQYPFQSTTEEIGQLGSTLNFNADQSVSAFFEDFFINKNSTDRGHRKNMLNGNYQEIGIGLAYGFWQEGNARFNTGILTTVYGKRKNARPIILGVVYRDNNHNQLYDTHEGIGKVWVSVSQENSTHTAGAGGYGLEVESNSDYTLTFSDAALGTVVKTVHVEQQNIKVDVSSSEFVAAAKQCATFKQDAITIPCIEADGLNYKIKLGLLDWTNLRFGLQYLSSTDVNPHAQCEHYDTSKRMADLNCVDIDNKIYAAKITQEGSVTDPIFKVQIRNP